ncbi:UNVERIFIED_CONTAM: hypothetical protein FKN15_063988 [Acipenser sinensis]
MQTKYVYCILKESGFIIVSTVRQEQELRNGSAVDKKLSTLADLFRPPIDLMHKGSFETAKECGQMENKWLMINIQNVQDFACQCLNRDVWSNDAVKAIVREHFIFWQEQELRNGSAVDKKLSTLADLFRPPIDLMHKGSFETAKECGQMENKWLMINIQNVQDFACQCLNRDVWSNDAVKAIVREHFIFWQVYHDSEEGQRYIQFYKLNEFPYISILDPRTGQKLVELHQLDVNSFLEQLTGFLTEHGQLDGLSSSPPKKRMCSESLIDASEDSQLEAAIQASLQETHYESNEPKIDYHSEEESDAEPFSDSEGLISVDGSDDEVVVEQPQPQPRSEPQPQPQPLPQRQDSPPKSKKSPHKESSHRKEESKKNHLEFPARTEAPRDSGAGNNHHAEPAENSGVSETQEEEPYSPELLDDNGPKARLMLRYPDGQREQISLPTHGKLLALVKHVQSKGYPNERFELVTNFPRRKLSHLDYDITLQDAGLCPQETVFIQERN